LRQFVTVFVTFSSLPPSFSRHRFRHNRLSTPIAFVSTRCAPIFDAHGAIWLNSLSPEPPLAGSSARRAYAPATHRRGPPPTARRAVPPRPHRPAPLLRRKRPLNSRHVAACGAFAAATRRAVPPARAALRVRLRHVARARARTAASVDACAGGGAANKSRPPAGQQRGQEASQKAPTRACGPGG
ncbi:unnamed protein product, partial [Closterium sp. NIES-54]